MYSRPLSVYLSPLRLAFLAGNATIHKGHCSTGQEEKNTQFKDEYDWFLVNVSSHSLVLSQTLCVCVYVCRYSR